ncbi:RNA polymerase sigma factor [Corynebacterium lubricantis]|uniref:RNA polymerase sigma factor n=1 Tax=Corynebacterium lubricantis TaxID=541095 RepID=UPI00037A5825|nr:sigma-70 family RNA polymerase sigma factor [Corynebacterium lubricantis]
MAVAPHISGTISTHSTDQELINAFNLGEARAFSIIVERHRPRLLPVARRYAKNEHDAQDILQEALFKAACNLQGFRNEATLSTWLNRLVMNSGYDHIKHRRRIAHLSLDDAKLNTDSNPALGHDPISQLDRVIMLRQIMGRLPAAQRRAILLIDVAGLTVERAAREMGVRPGTIKSRRARGREALHKQLTREQ